MRSATELQKLVDSAFVTRDVFDLLPDYLVLLIAVDGMTPSCSDGTSEKLLQIAESAAKERLASTAITEFPPVKIWRDCYKLFGAKPKKYQSSIEALMRRVPNGGLPRVNRLTDIYNAISVQHAIPLGGESLDAYIGAPRLLRARGTEPFETKNGVDYPEVGEVIWCDDAGTTCRNWNWRQCVRTCLRDDTTSALFILDGIHPVTTKADLERAGKELVEALREGSCNLVVAQKTISMSEEPQALHADC